ncbi:flagellar hook-associated protein FlgK [Halomonas sp.]|uniref:flagellar hook-associated protein FlgK n=1 Tax=Halomonas sp. TaxID=1486246 RepID=UPI003850A59D
MSIYSIGLSGLNAAQNALNTTSNNISNVYTPGYNRELTVLGEARGDGGVQVNDIQRQFNQYVANQLNSATSSSSALAAYQGQISQIDNLLADRDAGLAPLMQSFFSSLEDLASAPSDPAARQGVLGTAQTLAAQFQSFDSYLQDMQAGINGQIRDEVTQINNTTEQLATLNREIGLARARSGEAPNGLLNQRDQLVAELSERMDVRLNIQDGKTYNVSLPNGQPLVSGTNTFKLEVMDAPDDPQRSIIGYNDSGNNLIALREDAIKGGTLGGLMAFREESLDKAQNDLGQLAISLAKGVNDVHTTGLDLNGDPGEPFFAIDLTSPSRAAGSLEVAISDLDQIAAAQPSNPDDDPADWVFSGTGDNRNALALQDLQNAKLVGDPDSGATLNQAYASMVSDVGNKTNVVQVNLEARQGLTDQLRAVQQSESGVNLDEEAANLLRYQQFYAANARVIDTASTIFDTILGLRS